MATFYLQNFGCRANQSEGAALGAELERRGLEPAPSATGADWVVLNTCTVTAAADREAQRAIRRLRREHPGARIVVTGCYAQRAPAEVAGLEGVAMVVGNAHKSEIAARLAAHGGGLVRIAAPASGPALPPPPTRPTVKVQDGCDRRCSYCVVPQVRGAGRSLPLGGVLEQIERHVAAGALEVVISGINLGEWGRDLGPRLRLPDLVGAILEQTSLARLRLSSIEPMDWMNWGDALTGLLAGQPRLARHVHLPLQSGSDATLRRMRRRYTAAQYAATVGALRARVPRAAIGADVMVGFPGETEAEFEETLASVGALPFTYLHVFRYSARPGTEAARHVDSGRWRPVAAAAAAERAAALRRLIAAKRAAFLQSLVGLRFPVVTLAEPWETSGVWGLSDNFIKFAIPGAEPANRMVEVEAARSLGDALEGHRTCAPEHHPKPVRPELVYAS